MNEVEWKPFELGKTFNIRASNSGIDRNKLLESEGDIPYITRTNLNNGIGGYIGESQLEIYEKDKGNVITIGLDTQTVHYQDKNFFTGQNIQVLEHEKMNKQIAKFLIPLIKILMNKFSWGSNGATLTRLKRSKILLPVKSDNTPDWYYMEQYIQRQESESVEETIQFLRDELAKISGFKQVTLEDVDWQEFKVNKLFYKIQRGKRLTRANQIEGSIPYVSSTALNNGVDNYVSDDLKVPFRRFKNVLVIANSGSVGTTTYHPYEFVASDHVTTLFFKDLNKYVAMFLKTSLSKIANKYTFNREINDTRINNEKIMLPATLSGEPDYEFMENYIKGMKYDSIMKAINFIENKNKDAI